MSLGDEQGTRVTSAISPSVSRDTRDNVFTPARGNFSSLGMDFAGIGGDSKFVKFTGATSEFLPIWFNHILALHLEAVPRNDLLRLPERLIRPLFRLWKGDAQRERPGHLHDVPEQDPGLLA